MKKNIIYLLGCRTSCFMIIFIFLMLNITGLFGENITISLQTGEQNYTVCAHYYGQDTLVINAPTSIQGLPLTWYLDTDSVASGDFLRISNFDQNNLHILLKNKTTQQILLFDLNINYWLTGASTFPLNQSGGIWDNGFDTLWKCSDLINIGMSIPLCARCIDESNTNFAWIGPSGQISNTNFATIATDGLYYIQFSNSCYSVNVDSFVVISQAFNLPQWHDTTFCNSVVNIDLDCGPGWHNILWNNGSHDRLIHVDTVGLYSVQLSSVCTTATSSVQIYQIEVPEPSFISLQSGAFLCADSLVILNPHPGYLYDSYIWNTGDNTPQIEITGTSGLYSVTVSKSTCHMQASLVLRFFGRPLENNICYVTFDNLTAKNKIVWKSEQMQLQDSILRLPVDYFNIYISQPGTGWTLLSSTPATNWNEYIDQQSVPTYGYYKYKIAAKDQCGAIGDFSEDRSSIYLQAYPVENISNRKLEWNHSYTDNSVIIPSKYYIYKGTNAQELQLFDSIPDTENEYFDFNSNPNDIYQICGLFDFDCSPANTNVRIYSNIYISSVNSIENEEETTFLPYPNPAKDFLFVQGFDNCYYLLFNNSGQIVKNDCVIHSFIDIHDFAKGIYFLEIRKRDKLYRFSIEKQ